MMTIYYYRVTRTTSDLARIPLRQVGPKWSVGDRAAGVQASGDDTALDAGTIPPAQGDASGGRRAYVPIVRKAPKPLPPDDPTGCPCGWFTPDGRMVDMIPGPP